MAKKSKTEIRKAARERTRKWRARKRAAAAPRAKDRVVVRVLTAPARARLQDAAPMSKAERLAVLRVRAERAFETFTEDPSALNYGALNTVLLAYQLASFKAEG